MNTGKRLRLSQLRNPDCRACTLWKSSENVCVMGRGSPHARILAIGEAPGEAESHTGMPFMGQAGKRVLDPILDELELQDKVYITNVCKCRPPDNRKPTPLEMSTCSKLYLQPESKVVDSHVWVLLGKTPIEMMFNGNSFERHRLYYFMKPFSVYVVPTWHPAYILHSGSRAAYRQLQDAFKAAKGKAYGK